VKGKHFKTKYRPVGILLNFYAMIYFKFKLQLKFTKNKNSICLLQLGSYMPLIL